MCCTKNFIRSEITQTESHTVNKQIIFKVILKSVMQTIKLIISFENSMYVRIAPIPGFFSYFNLRYID